MHALTFCLIALCCATSSLAASFGGSRGSFGGSRGSISISRPVVAPRPVVVVRPQPRPVVVVHPNPSRPVVVVRPNPPRTVVVVKPSPSVIVIRRRPVTYVPIIYPIYHPIPVTTVVITSSHQQQVNIPTADCTKSGVSIFQYCQAEVARNYAPATLNTTLRTCCSTYAEASCYIQNAGQYCQSSSTASALIKHSQDVAKYFGSSICQAVDFSSWDSTCTSSQDTLSKKYYTNSDSKPAFIALPTDTGNEKTCLDKLRQRAQPVGDITKRCVNASLDAWDPTRSKMVSSQVFESCCAMYDALDCLVEEAKGICTDSELADLSNYKTTSTGAFSQGVCRAVPYSNVGQICRGYYSAPTGASLAALPSTTAMAVLALLVLLAHAL